ncbi:NAD-dependent deacylase [Nesterenkonia sp. E16_7]|uniref:SIR2 family NAD-dependent protein deacylase n=1 Tax=unclassified Nesterenkonia TaxID=2629769 RepID=UPI001A917ADE|nr:MULTISPECIES: NAD-dependent deacylase [unclassified Nesterenkonia]MBO0594410.1 NAD-dependent deacylase [Nesterenkonia sp. E16_10]MBO0598311.1 NAD-dependent deacylase [Nesterenkonia sp. E16_7]
MSAASEAPPIPEEVLTLARAARRVAVFSGAGISAESGVPTFREVQAGLWERFSAQDLATPEAFENDPALVHTWYRWRAGLIQQVAPNPGHRALAQWQQALREAGGSLSIATQNVDDLHERAGAEVLAHLHGSITAHRCADCEAPVELPASRYDGAAAPSEPEDAPLCQVCEQGLIRPGVVWFGEPLPMAAFDAAAEAMRAADLILVVGTSGLVQPAASLPLLGMERGTALIEINPEPTELSDAMHHRLRGPAGELLPLLVESITGEELGTTEVTPPDRTR